MWTDAHCHLDDPAFDADRAAVLARAAEAGVQRYLLAGVDPATWARQRALVHADPTRLAWAAGLHPMRAAELSAESTAEALEALPSCFEGAAAACALGETGLDTRFVDRETLPRQEAAFRDQLALARALERPVVLHLNGPGTYGRALDLLRRDGVPIAGGMVHAFSGSAEVADAAVRLGLHVSFCGTVCRPAARKVHRAAVAVPADRLLVETDAPDLPPPGSPPRNEPVAVLAVAQAVAELRGTTRDAVLDRAAANAAALFRAWTGPADIG
jgi:TatD DNase family protein